MSDKVLHIYIDESGTKDNKYLCILGVCLDNRVIFRLRDEVSMVFDNYKIRKEYRNLKRLRKNLSPFKELSSDQKYNLSNSIYDRLKKT